MTLEIPLDILLRIAQFVPENKLKNMLTVNSAFFDMAMNARYRQMSFYDLGNGKVMRRLERLRDPTVARRVRKLHVRLFLTSIVRRFGQKFRDFRWNEELMRFVTEVVANLPNVVDFTIGHWDAEVESYLPLFFRAAWSGFGPTLEILSLEGGIDTSKIPIPSLRLPALREMHWLIPGSVVTPETTNDAASFVNALGVTVRTLSICSWGSWDLSPFCGHLGPLPILERLRISMPFNEIMSDPAGLTHLLHTHASTLRHVYLRLDPGSEEGEGNLGRWMCENVSHTALLCNLKTLEVSLSPLADFDALMAYISRSANTLTKLNIMHRFCSYTEVDTITSVFAHHPPNSGLASLGLNVRFFGPRLLDLLSVRLPNLDELNLNAFNWGEEDWIADEREEAFESEMRSRLYSDWRLSNIGLWLRLGYDEMVMKKVDYNDMLLLADSVPSLQKFWGKYILTSSNVE